MNDIESFVGIEYHCTSHGVHNINRQCLNQWVFVRQLHLGSHDFDNLSMRRIGVRNRPQSAENFDLASHPSTTG